MNHKIPFITNDDILNTITMSDAIESMDIAFKLISENKAVIPLRINMHMEEVNADSLIMPVYSPELKQYSVKTVSLNYNNKDKNLPLIHTLLTLFDAENGKPIAIMDAEIITAMRTGAGSGLASKGLSLETSKELVAFGAGIQSEYQIRGVLAVRNIERVTIISRTELKAKNLIQKLQKEFDCIFIFSNDLVTTKNADIITTATTSTKPLFSQMSLKNHVHINAVGSYKPSLIELDPEMVASSKLFLDQKSACMNEAGDIQNALKNGYQIKDENIFELGTISNQSNEFKNIQTIFKSVGNAIQDLVLASVIAGKM